MHGEDDVIGPGDQDAELVQRTGRYMRKRRDDDTWDPQCLHRQVISIRGGKDSGCKVETLAREEMEEFRTTTTAGYYQYLAAMNRCTSTAGKGEGHEERPAGGRVD